MVNKISKRVFIKELSEFFYWKAVKLFERGLKNDHYEYFYTTYFQLSKEYYDNKAILDIGCGPRGSLEWAERTKERIGLDPLADKYLNLGAYKHKLTYIKGYSENIPFADNHFDVLCSFNSLDHVKDIPKTCCEIKRVLKPGGIFLLIVDIHSIPTITEPQKTNWSIISDFFSEFEIVNEKHLERKVKTRIYSNLRANQQVSLNKKYGVLSAMLKKL
ncbi:MAG: class I SAM-dependent methyltransferase [Salinivirgaceae bacterium]|jgi:ubiquinone/menaquinone biosynthesis C-methylase UbiE|nr:class I SAM-dependent methyltransferase [Salinivirgaceae bacterium]